MMHCQLICARQAEQLNPARDDLICLGAHFQIVSCRRPDVMTTCGMIYRVKQEDVVIRALFLFIYLFKFETHSACFSRFHARLAFNIFIF